MNSCLRLLLAILVCAVLASLGLYRYYRYLSKQMMSEIESLEQEIYHNARYEIFAGRFSYIDFNVTKRSLVDKNFQKVIDINENLDSLTLFFRIPSSVCNPCYDEVFNQIMKKLNNNKRSKFIILSDITKLKSYRVYFRRINLDKYVFGLNSQYFLNKKLDSEPYPYFLLYDKHKMRVSNLFVINNGSITRTKEYLQYISKLL